MRAVEKLLASKRLLVHLSRDFTPVGMFQSFCPEDMVLADLIYSDLVHHEFANIEMFTIDTGRLPDAVLYSIELIQQRYGDVIKVYYPNASELENFDACYSLRDDASMKHSEIRLCKPLKRALRGKKALISARDIFNESTKTSGRISWDKIHVLPRFNPLARWTKDEISAYAKHHNLPIPGHFRDIPRQATYLVGLNWWHVPERFSWESRHIA